MNPTALAPSPHGPVDHRTPSIHRPLTPSTPHPIERNTVNIHHSATVHSYPSLRVGGAETLLARARIAVRDESGAATAEYAIATLASVVLIKRLWGLYAPV
ncbi:DUF4244 domain-containing protein [Herbiconiux daphne]|uniref:DUF4244 domain-containing protein n=1 Tax=Herbiconiux daphne TaxID=2970914 RepID=A0ABT2H6H4_9MICO|nr:DUF4244 domain-containing protein [Herbiconiux daphne]MCS5735524.1 DUF4244 domain-containing protein [Herbiconiux daphne]